LRAGVAAPGFDAAIADGGANSSAATTVMAMRFIRA
jgi:hypothetical protein